MTIQLYKAATGEKALVVNHQLILDGELEDDSASLVELIGERLAVDLDWVLWTAGTVGGLFTALTIPFMMFTRQEHSIDQMTAVWLLPVVAAEVAAAEAGKNRKETQSPSVLPGTNRKKCPTLRAQAVAQDAVRRRNRPRALRVARQGARNVQGQAGRRVSPVPARHARSKEVVSQLSAWAAGPIPAACQRATFSSKASV